MKASSLDNDLKLISGEFFEVELPKSKRYLFKYFTTRIQRYFVRYYYVFGNTKHFVDHTGIHCKIRWLQVLTKKLKKLETEMEQARAEINMALVAKIESGKHEF